MTQASDTAFAAAHLAVGIIAGLVERGLISKADVENMMDAARAGATVHKHDGALALLEREIDSLVDAATTPPEIRRSA